MERLRDKAREVAMEIAESGPLAVRSIRRTMRRGLADRIRVATDHELVEQDWLRTTDDFKEGIASTAERRTPRFVGR
jgi:enoyl-CoA hydratase/carnithine racemase